MLPNENSPARKGEAVGCLLPGDDRGYTIPTLTPQRTAERWPILSKHWAPAEVLALLAVGALS